MLSKTSAHNNHHERVPKRKPLSFEPITNSFVPNYFQLLISNSLMTTYRATSANYSDGKLYSIQRIENVPTSASALWIRRWNHILELSKADSSGVLNYFACHIEKNVNAEISTVYLVSEYTANTLKEAKHRLNLPLADVIRAMFQVSEALSISRSKDTSITASTQIPFSSLKIKTAHIHTNSEIWVHG